MISRALFTVLFAVSAISSANQQRRMESTPSGYSSYQDEPYSHTPILSLYRKLHDGLVSKRNNAEVVNHILKNFGTLDRLGDVGK